MSKTNYASDSDSGDEVLRKVLDGAEHGLSRQTRFTRIPGKYTSPTNDTVCGIRDMTLGRVKNGKPVGGAIIRFDKSVKTGDTHINIDPKGFSSKANPHISVSESTIELAKTANKTLKYLGKGLTVAAFALDAWCFANAIADDIYIKENAKEIIKELEETIEELKENLEEQKSSKRKKQIRDTIEHLESVLKDVRRIQKNVPAKTIKQCSSIVGGWTGGAAGGAAGAWSGAASGAAVGSLFGPVGTVVGAPVGAAVGALGLGITGGIVGGSLGEYAAEMGLEHFVD